MSMLNYEAMCKLMLSQDEILASPLRKGFCGGSVESDMLHHAIIIDYAEKLTQQGHLVGSDRHVDWNRYAKNIVYIVVTP